MGWSISMRGSTAVRPRFIPCRSVEKKPSWSAAWNGVNGRGEGLALPSPPLAPDPLVGNVGRATFAARHQRVSDHAVAPDADRFQDNEITEARLAIDLDPDKVFLLWERRQLRALLVQMPVLLFVRGDITAPWRRLRRRNRADQGQRGNKPRHD